MPSSEAGALYRIPIRIPFRLPHAGASVPLAFPDDTSESREPTDASQAAPVPSVFFGTGVLLVLVSEPGEYATSRELKDSR